MGRRESTAKTDDGKLEVKLDPSKVMGGGGTGTNPEQLFAADSAACFIGSLKFVANSQKMPVPTDTSIDSNVSFGPRNGQKGSGIAVELVVDIPGMDKAQAESLVHQAHEVCPLLERQPQPHGRQTLRCLNAKNCHTRGFSGPLPVIL